MATIVDTVDLVFKDWITYISTTSPYVFGNEDAKDPSTGKKLDDGNRPWYRVSVRESGGGRANLNGQVGTRKYERLGFLAIQCFAPVNAGDKLGLQMAEAARTYFEDRRLNNLIIYLNADIRPQPPDGKWNPVLLEVVIEFTDTK